MDTAGNSNNAFVAAVLSEVSDERGTDRDGPVSTSCVFCGVAVYGDLLPPGERGVAGCRSLTQAEPSDVEKSLDA